MTKYFVALFFICILAYFLRIMFLPQGALTFGYDQARDATIALQIANGDLKIIGPPASTPGLYHGVLYYYILVPAYALGAGNPIIAALWMALINTVSIFLVFYLTYLFTKKPIAALLGALIIAISFEATQYAVWLSNPTIGIWTVPLIYLGLWVWLREKRSWGAIVCAVGLGFSIQAEIFLAYHIIPVLLWIYLFRKHISKSQLRLLVITFVLSISSMLLSEFKFGFKSLGGIASLLNTGEQVGFGTSVGDYFVLYLNQLGRVFAYSVYPPNVWIGGTFVFGVLFYQIAKREKKQISWQLFLATWIFSHITIVALGGSSTPFLLVGMAPAVAILIGITIFDLYRNQHRLIAVIVISIILFGNIKMILRENPKGQTIFAIQKDMLLSKQIKAIDYTYDSAKAPQFSINSLTSPLWINIVWTYLYKWHGQGKYGFLPVWSGRDQVGIVDSLPQGQILENHYLILEPMAGIPQQYLPLTLGEEDARSSVIEEKNFGEIVIQKREKLN